MRTARLTADLLARKGEARALADTYGTPLLDPILRPVPAPHPARPAPAASFRASCSLPPEEHRRLRILAARLERSVSELVREAVRAFLDEHRDDCACVAALARNEPATCCRGDGFGRARSSERG
jgi:predicted DNA-binding protein